MKRKFHPPRGTRLFGEPERPRDAYIAHVDGAARGNPGPAAYAVIVHDAGGRELFRLGKSIGRNTNNVAEYHGLVAALDYAASHGIRRMRVRSDSELLVRQMQGLYKVKSPELRPLHERAMKLARGLEYFAIEHVPREANREADRLANAALDGAGVARGFSGVRSPVDSTGVQRPDSAAPPAALKGGATEKRARAVYRHGALHPTEPLGLDEGEEIEVTIRRIGKPPRGHGERH